MKHITSLLLATCFALVSSLSAFAQSPSPTLATTTVTIAIVAPTAGQPPSPNLTVASNAGITAAPPTFVYIDRELMQVTAISGTTLVTVRRGQGGTTPQAHLINSIVYIGTAQNFTTVDYVGACVPTNQVLPQINVSNGNIFNCSPSGATSAGTTNTMTLASNTWQAWNIAPVMENKPRSVTVGAAYTILPTDYIVALTTNGFGAAGVTVKSYTLPNANAVGFGKMLIINDESGVLSATTSIVLIGTINGTNSSVATVIQMKTPFMSVGLYSGSNGWFTLWCTGAGVQLSTGTVNPLSMCR